MMGANAVLYQVVRDDLFKEVTLGRVLMTCNSLKGKV